MLWVKFLHLQCYDKVEVTLLDWTLTSHKEIGVRESILCLHKRPGMSVVKDIKHTISIHPYWFYRVKEEEEEEEVGRREGGGGGGG